MIPEIQPAPLLSVHSLTTGYGTREVLSGVSVEAAQGEIVALIGYNGAGKSTLLKAVFGLVPVWEGQVFLEGRPIPAPTPRALLAAGVSYLPQGNRIFPNLTVYQNLEMGGRTLPNRKALAEGIEGMLTLFPALKERLKQQAAALSGQERQMLALANALILNPRLLLLDEPSLGLDSATAAESLSHIEQISRAWAATVIIVEQRIREVLSIAQKVYVLRNGRVTYSGPETGLSDETEPGRTSSSIP
jgi:branched-chain amino acid transport system ATP-binding protein